MIRCIALLFLKPRHLNGGGCSAPLLAALPQGKTRYPLYRSLGGPQGRSGRVWKTSPPPAFDLRTVQPVAISLEGLRGRRHYNSLVKMAFFFSAEIRVGYLPNTRSVKNAFVYAVHYYQRQQVI